MNTRRSWLGRKPEVTEACSDGGDPVRGEVTCCGFCGIDVEAPSPVVRRFGTAFCSEAHAEAFVSEVRAARTQAVALTQPSAPRDRAMAAGADQPTKPGPQGWDLKWALKMAVCCGLPILAVVALAGGGGALLGAGAAILPVLALLACPLGMLFMMWGMRNHGKGKSDQAKPTASDDERRAGPSGREH